MTTFTVDDAFPLARVDLTDKRFMSRLDREAWETQVQALMVEIAQQGLLAPVGIARLAGEQRYVIVYGFTRSAAVARLGWPTIRANVYEDLAEADARLLNAGDNAWHTQLTDWERALQLRKLRAMDIPVESANGGPSLTRIFNMGRRTVFNWLRIVEYDLPALHQAIADKKLGLQHALVFRDYAPEISAAWIERCIQGEWSSRELKLRLSAAGDEIPEDAEEDEPSPPERATVHGGMASQTTPASAPVHGAEAAVDPHLVKAGRWLLQVSSAQIQQLGLEAQQQLKTGLRMVLEVIASMRAD
jgi:ParB-like nuclease domain